MEKRNKLAKNRRGSSRKRTMSPFIVMSGATILKNVVKGNEVKFYSANLTSTWSSVSTTQVTLDATDAIASGTSWNQRIGTKVRILGIAITGALCGGQTSGVADDPYNSFRMLITEQDYSGTVTATTPGYVTTAQSLNVDKIHACRDLILQSSGSDSTGYMPTSAWINWPVTLNVLVKYNSAGHPINSLKVTMVSDSSTTPNPGFTNGQWTIAFIDS